MVSDFTWKKKKLPQEMVGGWRFPCPTFPYGLDMIDKLYQQDKFGRSLRKMCP